LILMAMSFGHFDGASKWMIFSYVFEPVGLLCHSLVCDLLKLQLAFRATKKSTNRHKTDYFQRPEKS
jgi:hypothetical protein